MGPQLSDYVASAGDDAPAVVVAHDWYGRLPHVLAFCDRLAEQGFTAVAPDAYGGRTTTDPAVAETYVGGLDEDAAVARLVELIGSLRGEGGERRVGAVGFSMGGGQVVGAVYAKAPDCAVLYYAPLWGGADEVACPVLAHLAETDEFDPPEETIAGFEKLRSRGIETEVHVYPGTEHSFANRDVPLWNEGAFDQAWERTVAFLTAHLRR
jgi:carboxymethylenebutenolidase